MTEHATRRILLVDDEPGILKLLSMVFRAAGYLVRTASDGFEATSICQTEAFDVVVSDVRMPGMDGHELVRRIVSERPDTLRILMSGYDDLACQHCGKADTPCTLVGKPFRPKDVLALVESLLARQAEQFGPATLIRLPS